MSQGPIELKCMKPLNQEGNVQLAVTVDNKVTVVVATPTGVAMIIIDEATEEALNTLIEAATHMKKHTDGVMPETKQELPPFEVEGTGTVH